MKRGAAGAAFTRFTASAACTAWLGVGALGTQQSMPATFRGQDAVLEKFGPQSLVVILPEGRMMRVDGLDKHGKPMTMRGGIADLLQLVPHGRMLIAYSGGLHHVQVPGQRFPKLFKTIRMNLEILDIADYRGELMAHGDADEFRRRVKRDLEARRDRYCPVRPETAGPASHEASKPSSSAT